MGVDFLFQSVNFYIFLALHWFVNHSKTQTCPALAMFAFRLSLWNCKESYSLAMWQDETAGVTGLRFSGQCAQIMLPLATDNRIAVITGCPGLVSTELNSSWFVWSE